MTIQSREFVAGSFVIGGLIGFLAIIAVLGDFLERTDQYYTKVNNVAGLKSGAAVIYEGYIIGSVTEIDPQPTDEGMSFHIGLAIKEGWQIPETSEANIASLSLLSAMAIQINAGTGPALAPGSEIRMSPQMNFVDELSKTADNFARIAEDHVVPLLNTVDELLTQHGTQTFDNVNVLTKGLATEVPQVTANLNNAIDNLNQLIASVDPDAINGAINDVDGILDDVDVIMGDVKTASSRLSQSMDGVDAVIENSVQASANVEATTETLNSITEDDLAKILKEMRFAAIILKEIMKKADDAALDINDLTTSGGGQVLTILDRLDRAALNIEEMTNMLKNNPGVLITGTE